MTQDNVYVLYIPYANQPLIKVGYSDNINQRLAIYKNYNPRCRILLTCYRPNPNVFERYIHSCFKPTIGREWYDAKLKTEILTLIKTTNHEITEADLCEKKQKKNVLRTNALNKEIQEKEMRENFEQKDKSVIEGVERLRLVKGKFLTSKELVDIYNKGRRKKNRKNTRYVLFFIRFFFEFEKVYTNTVSKKRIVKLKLLNLKTNILWSKNK